MDSSRPLIENEDRYLTTSKFESCEALVKSAREYYYTKGYGVSIRNSKKDKFVTLQCDCGGSYRDIRGIQDKRQKKATTRLISCPFRIIGSKGVNGTWVYKPKDLKHNHEPSSDMSGHPSFRQLPPDTVQTVEEMTKSGIPPRQILSSLRQQNPDLPAKSRTIYNVKRKIKRDNLGNRSVIGALFEEFEKDGFAFLESEDEESYTLALKAFKNMLGQGSQLSVIISDRELDGHFTATMGLPLAHKIKGHRERSLLLELVHPQWRINSLSLNTKDALVYDGYSTFRKLLDELDSKY
uniref:uncharacterized protein LOC122604303 n=1 Tax=Erigeron canadensis TaxID=72917 RepID=UPI001CB97B61|nr:uncharacterized protein LOC122604303 [Erigeron canadensis]